MMTPGRLMAAYVAGHLHSAGGHGPPVDPEAACALMWDAWVVSWVAAGLWSRRAAARPPALDQILYWLAPGVGILLLAFGSIGTHVAPLWHVEGLVAWLVVGASAAGLLFTWWARVWLGSLWSAAVSRKDDHSIVQSGPYAMVRHPIYTGLILAAFAQATVTGQAANLAGAGLMALGFWLKARFEERFLGRQLGADAYADYRRRTPMLIPFWPTGARRARAVSPPPTAR